MDSETQNNEAQNSESGKEKLVDVLHKDSRLPQLRTYQGDIAKFIKTKDQSAVSIALKEKEEKDKKEKEKWLKKQREEQEKKQKDAQRKHAEELEYKEREKRQRKEEEERHRKEEKERAERAVEEAEEKRRRELQEAEAKKQMAEMEAQAKQAREEAFEKAKEQQQTIEEKRQAERARQEEESKKATRLPEPTLNAAAAVDELARELEEQIESEKARKAEEEKERQVETQKVTQVALQEAPPPSRASSNMITIVLSLFLLAGSLVVAGYAYLWRDISEPVVDVNYGPLIRPDEKMVVEASGLTRESLKDELAVAKKNVGEGKIIELKATVGAEQREASITELLEKLNFNMPSALARSLDDYYILGVYGERGGGSLFLIFRETDYGIAFRDMLEWEKTLYGEFQPLTSSLALSALPPAGGFKDYILFNKDTRAVLVGANKVQLLYTFLDKNTILITESGSSLKGLLDAYATRNLVR